MYFSFVNYNYLKLLQLDEKRTSSETVTLAERNLNGTLLGSSKCRGEVHDLQILQFGRRDTHTVVFVYLHDQ